MALFLLDDAAGVGSDDLDTFQAFVDLVIIANDDGVGLDDPAGGLQRVTYTRTAAGAPQLRLDALVNTDFTPDYGAGPLNVDIVVIPALSGFTLDDGTPFSNEATALPPSSSGLPGADSNTTDNCLVIYDTQQNLCGARAGTSGTINLPFSNPVVLYHELSHTFRILNNALLALTTTCNPSSPEENAAIVDENELRTQIANRQGVTPELRDPDIHCGSVGCGGGCCIIATVASRSLSSHQVQHLRKVRDHFVRSTEVGHAFFERFFYDYYAFSPQVCTLTVGKPRLLDHFLAGFIDPLLDFWKVVIERSAQRLDGAAIGAAFARQHADAERARLRQESLERTIRHWFDHEAHEEIPSELIALLEERAWPSEYVQWALVAPVRIYHELLTSLLNGADEPSLGLEFARAIEAWAPELPISEVWASLAADQVEKELAFLGDVLLQSNASQQRFGARLIERHRGITSIQTVLTGSPSLR